MKCIQQNNISQVEKELKDCSDLILMEMPDGGSLLHYTAAQGQVEMMQCLIKFGALQQEGRKKYAKTPLHEAAIHGKLQICKLLVQHSCLVDCHTTRGRTPLMYAARGGFVDILQFLIDEGGNINEQDDDGISALHLASMVGQIDTVQVLVQQKNLEIDLRSKVQRTALLTAVAHSQLHVIAYLLENGASIDVVDSSGVTVWHEVAARGNVDAFDILLQFGSIRNGCDKIRARHPIHYAAIEGNTDLITALLDRRLVDMNIQDLDGCTAVYYAATNGHVDSLKCLLEHGADPNICSRRRSPLHCAVDWDRYDCAVLLFHYGADVTILDSEGKTPTEKRAKYATVLVKR